MSRGKSIYKVGNRSRSQGKQCLTLNGILENRLDFSCHRYREAIEGSVFKIYLESDHFSISFVRVLSGGNTFILEYRTMAQCGMFWN
jgi:hypothetical protein